MDVISLLLIALALAMDAMAVSITSGVVVARPSGRQILMQAVFFGGFQFIMPVIGWLLVGSFSQYVKAVDHWIAFGLLAFIGIRMIIGAVKGEDGAPKSDPFALKTLVLMAIATSIDALAVGASFAVTDVDIWLCSTVIGAVAFMLSIVGVLIGRRVGAMFQKRAEIIGGAILIAIGIKILVEHLIG